MSKIIERLHKELRPGLKRLGISQLTDFQARALPPLLDSKNTLLASETGAGKSVAYMISILDKIYKETHRQSIINYLKDKGFEFIFNNGRQIIPYEKNTSMHGAMILVPNSELVNHTYKMLRYLDSNSLLNIHRTNSMADIAGIARYLVTFTQSEPEQSEDMQRKQGFFNMVNSVNWNILDIVVSTPEQMGNILAHKDAIDPLEVNPSTIVIDECDLLLQDEIYVEKTRGVLKRFLSTNSKFGEENNKRQFILSCSTLYERMGSSDSISVLSSMFKNLEVIKSENMHTLPKNVKLEFIPVSDSAEDSNSSNE